MNVALEGIYLMTSLHTQYFSPESSPPPLKAIFLGVPQPPSQCHQPQTTPLLRTDTRNGPLGFLCIEKRSHRFKRSKMFNYNIIYTISINILTLGHKIVERIFESGVFFLETKTFWVPPNQWRQPNYHINVSEDKKKHLKRLTYESGKNSDKV